MDRRPSYEELEQKLRDLEKQVVKYQKIEQALAENEARYKGIFEHTKNGVAVYKATSDGEDFIFIDFNRASEEIEKIRRKDVIGKSVVEVFPGVKEFGLFEVFKRVWRTGTPEHFPVSIYKDERIAGWRDNFVYKLPSGEIVAVYSDETERKQSEAALKDYADKIKLFAYSVAHDLRTPAIGINLITKSLHKYYEGILDEKGSRYCDLILKASEELAALIDQINVYISTKEVPLNIENVNLNQMFDIVKDEFSAQSIVRQISWARPDKPIRINADRLSILRVLRNFVDNALKYGGDELSEIEFEYRESDEFHILSVRDDGIGISKGDSEKIFGFFSRAVTAQGIQGSGLGLAIANEIAEKHKGSAWAEPGPEKGAVFCISILKDLKLTQ